MCTVFERDNFRVTYEYEYSLEEIKGIYIVL